MTASAAKKSLKSDKYYEAVGRRKTAIARVRLFDKKMPLEINAKSYKDYFKKPVQQQVVEAPLKLAQLEDKAGVSARVKGGGYRAQAEAICHGLARALVLFNPELRKKMRAAGYLTRDPRMVERKKYGLKKARRAPQWKKR